LGPHAAALCICFRRAPHELRRADSNDANKLTTILLLLLYGGPAAVIVLVVIIFFFFFFLSAYVLLYSPKHFPRVSAHARTAAAVAFDSVSQGNWPLTPSKSISVRIV
jgi:hypothetical protein